MRVYYTGTEGHYEKHAHAIYEIFWVVKNQKFQNRHCGYTLDPPRPGGSNEYAQSMFWSKNKKNRYTPAVLLYKSGV